MTNEKIEIAQQAIFEATQEAMVEGRHGIVLQLNAAYAILIPVREKLPNPAHKIIPKYSRTHPA